MEEFGGMKETGETDIIIISKMKEIIKEKLLIWNRSEGWRGDPTAKTICCSCRGLKFNSQHRHGGSQPPIPLVPRDLQPFSSLHGHLHAHV